MQSKLFRFFVASAGGLLLITSAAKIISSMGTAEVLQLNDPILLVTFRHLFWFVGTIELIVAIVCFSTYKMEFKISLLAWIATNFLYYRTGLLLLGYHKPCSCLGNFTEVLHIPEQTADAAMKIIFTYLLIGSYAILLWLWRQNKKIASVPVAA